MATEIELLEAQLARAKKGEELRAAKEAHDDSEESVAAIRALKDEVNALREIERQDRVVSVAAVSGEEGETVTVTPETATAGVSTVAGQGGSE